MNICFLLIAFIFLFIPGVIGLQQRNDPELLVLALISTVFISVSISIVLMYSARKKDLDWIWSFKKDEHDSLLGK
ncbi:MAG: hypothetical protein HY843_02595 [Bdellovibrio sp.]|nr:hypothetical protein [Bdellovibrio sp.]